MPTFQLDNVIPDVSLDLFRVDIVLASHLKFLVKWLP